MINYVRQEQLLLLVRFTFYFNICKTLEPQIHLVKKIC